MVENSEESKDGAYIPAKRDPRYRQMISSHHMKSIRDNCDNNSTTNNEPRFSDIEFTLGEESKIAKETTTYQPSYGDLAKTQVGRNNRTTRTTNGSNSDTQGYMAP